MIASNMLSSLCMKHHHHKKFLTNITKLLYSSSAVPSFKFEDLQVTMTKNPSPKPDNNNLVFGKQFADHMLNIDWTVENGWGKPEIVPMEDFKMHPGAKVFHYAIELFEGMKAYRGVDQIIRLYRPDKNMIRMRGSALRSAFPDFDGDELIKCLKKLVSVDQEWVPYSTSSTLYIRPTMIATEAALGVSPPTEVKLFVITGPVGPYYPTGFNPVSLLADPQFCRAWTGGSGAYKMGANYAPTILPQVEAMKQNCQQVLWLYGDNHQITEVGTMNFFMFWVNEDGENELVTPPLDSGLILPGVTRTSLLDLGRSWGEFKVTEKDFNMGDLLKALHENRVKEIFGAGTACIVCPVKEIIYEGRCYQIPTMEEGAPITNKFLKALTDIQYGHVESDWVETLD